MPLLGALVGAFLLSSAVSAVSPAQAAAPGMPLLPSLPVTLTGYNAVPAQTDGDPFITASGAYANPEVVAARSRDLADELPFGTIIEIGAPTATSTNCGFAVAQSLIGYRMIADTMNERFTNRVDVLFPTATKVSVGDRRVNGAVALGECGDVTVRVVGHVDITHPSALPKTQAELVQLLNTENLAVK